MQAPGHRKIELQSPADLTFLYANTVALSREKLDLHFPPPENQDDANPDPMKERVRELVDEFITKTFTTATPSISINGMDSSSTIAGQDSTRNGDGASQFPFQSSLATNETIEYEPYDADLAARVTSLYAQLESLTTTVAQLRRDAPAKAARDYTQALKAVVNEDDNDLAEEEGEQDRMDVDESGHKTTDDRWRLGVSLGSEKMAERWRDGEMADMYGEALKTLIRLQGEDADVDAGSAGGGTTPGLATTVGKVERAERAADVVEKI